MKEYIAVIVVFIIVFGVGYFFGLIHGFVFEILYERPDEKLINIIKDVLIETHDRYKDKKNEKED